MHRINLNYFEQAATLTVLISALFALQSCTGSRPIESSGDLESQADAAPSIPHTPVTTHHCNFSDTAPHILCTTTINGAELSLSATKVNPADVAHLPQQISPQNLPADIFTVTGTNFTYTYPTTNSVTFSVEAAKSLTSGIILALQEEGMDYCLITGPNLNSPLDESTLSIQHAHGSDFFLEDGSFMACSRFVDGAENL